MTAKEFYEALAETRSDGWRIESGRIRRGQHCPITWVAKKHGAGPLKAGNASYVFEAAHFLGLARSVMANIMCAADQPRPRPVRWKLMRALGFEEGGQAG